MPPKPKGLKASKRAAPFDPSSLPSDSTPSTSTSSSSSERTYPLDEDCLTLSDLFELRLTVLEILYPFPTDLTFANLDPEKLDEARSFLRGILHGCAVLEQYIKQGDYGKVAERDQEGNRSDEKVKERRKEAGKEKLGALGLGEEADPESLILYLQAWSLHQLGEIFEDPKEEIKTAALKLGGPSGNKKRKIDLNEPRTKVEWLEAGHAKYELGHDGLGAAWEEHDEANFMIMSLVGADFMRCKLSLAQCYLDEPERSKGVDLSKGAGWREMLERPVECQWGIGINNIDDVEDDDCVLAQLRSWAQWISFCERNSLSERSGWEDKFKEKKEKGQGGFARFERSIEVFTESAIEDAIDDVQKWRNDRAAEQLELWRWLRDVIVADLRMARFVTMEDAIETKYRPEDEDQEEDDEEVEVKELPMDAEDVKLVKKASQEAIEALRETITSFAELPASVAHPSGKDTQHRKLEEVLLISSALVNPSDKEATKRIEEEIEKVRKEGGLEDNEEATDGAEDDATDEMK